MTEITNELNYEILKSLQKGQAEIKAILSEHTRQFIKIREDINNLRSDDLRRETMQAQIDVRLDRIEARLDLIDE